MKRIIVSLALIIFTGCTFVVPRSVKEEFTYCFDGKKTGLDTLISINGYYAPSPDEIIQWNNRIWTNDTLRPAYVFYDNGFVFCTTGIDYFIENEDHSGRWLGEPGGYIIHGDTIKLQYVEGPGGMSRSMGELWFKIIDKNTIQRIDTKDRPLHPASERIFVFRPLEIRFQPEVSWIYGKRWFWCNKEDWKVYKNEKKENKRKNKSER
jgi:hypothetical protein